MSRARKIYPSQQELLKVYSYDPDTGLLTRKVRRSSTADVGTIAGTRVLNGGGIAVGTEKYLAHKLIWIMVYGINPDCEIDHINCDACDNRLANLRLATPAQNQANKSAYKNNTSGFKGVYWHKRIRRWRAMISCEGHRRLLGEFETAIEASAAYEAAAARLHGQFANCGGPK